VNPTRKLVHRLCRGTMDLLYPPLSRCPLCDRLLPTRRGGDCLVALCPACVQVRCGIGGSPPWLPPQTGVWSGAAASRRLFFVGPYRGRLAGMIRDFKYRGQRHLVVPLAHLMAEKMRGWVARTALITHVPLSAKRERQRGFDQARLLARGVAENLDLPHQLLLKRIRHTPPQVGQSRPNRLVALNGAFELQVGEEVPLEVTSVILLDDVYTTGATCEAAARALSPLGLAIDIAVLGLSQPPREYRNIVQRRPAEPGGGKGSSGQAKRRS